MLSFMDSTVCGNSENRYVVDVNALQHNICLVQTIGGKVPVWAVLKGDGYGLGLARMACILYSEGIDRFCVAEREEARMLGNAGLGNCKILMLQPTQDPETLRQLLRQNVIYTVSNAADAAAINEIAKKENKIAQVHVKIDTGMGRFGFQPSDREDILSVYRMDHLHVSGMYTHFACSTSKKKTWRQYEAFRAVIRFVADSGYDPGECHCCSSEAFLHWPELQMDGVRIGSAWLGRKPQEQRMGFQKVGYCESRIEQLHNIAKGKTSGYGGAWKAKKDTTLALVPVGWYHGFGVEYNRDVFRFRDALRGCIGWVKAFLTRKRLWVLVNGKQCPVCGHVGMMCTAVDVTEITCAVGDSVMLDISPLLKKDLTVEYQYASVAESYMGRYISKADCKKIS